MRVQTGVTDRNFGVSRRCRRRRNPDFEPHRQFIDSREVEGFGFLEENASEALQIRRTSRNGERFLTRSEIWRIEKYLRGLFRLDTITLLERPKQADSVEVHVAGEFIGVIFKDEEDGETTYAFQMAILEMDLPEAPPSRAG
jgi:hypothetical protein